MADVVGGYVFTKRGCRWRFVAQHLAHGGYRVQRFGHEAGYVALWHVVGETVLGLPQHRHVVAAEWQYENRLAWAQVASVEMGGEERRVVDGGVERRIGHIREQQDDSDGDHSPAPPERGFPLGRAGEPGGQADGDGESGEEHKPRIGELVESAYFVDPLERERDRLKSRDSQVRAEGSDQAHDRSNADHDRELATWARVGEPSHKREHERKRKIAAAALECETERRKGIVAEC